MICRAGVPSQSMDPGLVGHGARFGEGHRLEDASGGFGRGHGTVALGDGDDTQEAHDGGHDHQLQKRETRPCGGTQACGEGALRGRMTLGTVEHPVRWRTPRTSGEGTSGQRLWGISGAGVTILVGRGKSVLKLNLKPKRLMLMSKPTENRPTGQTPVTSAWVMP